MTQITTHVLDTAAGRPAPGIDVTLETRTPDGEWAALGSATTDADGRTPALGATADATHRLHFDLAAHHGSGRGFYPEVTITFEVGGEDHLHVPLLLSPYGYTTYRGS